MNKDIDYLVVSDASTGLKDQQWVSDDDPIQNVMRIWDITADQLKTFRVGAVFGEVISKGDEAYRGWDNGREMNYHFLTC